MSTSKGDIFGSSPITHPMFAFGILVLAVATFQVFIASMVAASNLTTAAFSGFAALHWIAGSLLLITGVFACIVAAKNKSSRFNVNGSIALSVLCTVTLIPCGGLMINDFFVYVSATTDLRYDAITPMNLAAMMCGNVFLIVLSALSVAHGAKSVKTSI